MGFLPRITKHMYILNVNHSQPRYLVNFGHKLAFSIFWLILMVGRVAEVGVLAATAKYPSVLATSARLQISESKTSFLQVHIFVLCFQWWESARL